MGMTPEERARKLLLDILGQELPAKARIVAAAIRAAEQEAEQRGKAAGLTMMQKRLSDDLADAMEALADLHENIVGEPVPCRSTPGGQPESPPSASELRDAILSAHCKPDAEAEQRGAAQEREALGVGRAAGDVCYERARQIHQEGWTVEHDDSHVDAEITMAAAAYTLATKCPAEAVNLWPWEASWWKPKDARSNLVRAAALLLAEIDRLDRIRARSNQQRGETDAG